MPAFLSVNTPKNYRMKKLVMLSVLTAGLFASGRASAQNAKLAYISVQDLIFAMPEFKKADTALAEYQAALNEMYVQMVQDFKKKDSMLTKDSAKFSKAVFELKRGELEQLYVKIQGWNEQAQQLYQNKQNELMTPVQSRAMKAIQDVAKENGYGYVLSRQALVVDPPPADDLMPLVKKKLGIK